MSREIPQSIGEYDILRVLGEGGMGVVYLARDHFDRLVALKMVRDELAADEELRRRFQRESHIALALRHPNIVSALDAGILGGRLFLACEFVGGGTLGDLLDAHGRLDEPRTLGVARDLLRALGAVHDAGLIHRDVKSANILIEPDGMLRLSDLGLARSTSQGRSIYTAKGMILCTPAFAAPEQFEGREDLDIRCDLYSAGILLWRCLAGRLPYVGERAIDVVQQHCFGPVADLARAAPGVSADVAAFVHDLMCKDRALRLQDPATALAHLTALIAGRSLTDTAMSLAPLLVKVGDGAVDFDPTRPATAVLTPARGPSRPWLDHAFRTMSVQRITNPSAAAVTRRLERTATAPGGGVRRVSVRFTDPAGERMLHVHGGSRLGFGRHRDDPGLAHASLRILNDPARVEATGRISGRHFEIHVKAGRAWICDLHSTGGTKLNGKTLDHQICDRLMPRNEIEVAGVLRLIARTVPAPDDRALVIPELGAIDGSPAVFVERPENGREEAYALVPGRLALAEGLEMVCADGRLWLARTDTTPPTHEAIVAGTASRSGDASIEIVETGDAGEGASLRFG